MKITKLLLLVLLIAFSASIILPQTKTSKAKPKAKKTVVEEDVAQTPPPPTPPSVQRGEDGAIVHLTYGVKNPERVLHALTFALELTKNYKVLVFLDIYGPEVVVTKLPGVELKKYEPSKLLVDKLLKKGVQILVCQTCLEALNYSEFDLMKGVKAVKTQDFFNFTDGRILTFAY